MKKIILLLACIIISHFQSLAQSALDENSVKLIHEETMMLNNGLVSSLLNGQSRKLIKIDLPDRAIGWMYVFTANLNNENTEKFKLLTKSFISSTSLVGSFASLGAASGPMALVSNFFKKNITPPSGDAAINLYVLDASNENKFLNKANFQFISDGTVENRNDFKYTSSNLLSKHFSIGIQNVSTFERRVYVNISVYAIMKPSESGVNSVTNGWSMENKQKMFNRWIKAAMERGADEFAANSIAACTQKSILSSKSFADYTSTQRSQWEEFVKSKFEECYKSFSNK
jgi:hypothetical protein